MRLSGKQMATGVFISGVNRSTLALVTPLVGAGMLYVLYMDLNGHWINQTIIFEMFGPAAFFIFYGSGIAALVSLARRFRFKDEIA
jgi:hypothetical protein